MNPKLKTALAVAAVALIFVGVVLAVVEGAAYLIARSVTEPGNSPILDPLPQAKSPEDTARAPLVIASFVLAGIGMILHKQFEYTNKTLKILGAVFIALGAVGCILSPFILAIFF